MTSVHKSARTVDEAIDLALAELKVTRDQVDVDILDEGERGFLGLIGGRNALVKVTLKKVQETKADLAEAWLEELCRTMGVTGYEVTVTDAGEHIAAEIKGQEAGMLIGHRGQTLEAIQYLLNLSLTGRGGPRVVVDVEGYRKRREATLVRLAERTAERVRRTGRAQTLEPMSAAERRIIHVTLQGQSDITTGSIGEEPRRRVVVELKR